MKARVVSENVWDKEQGKYIEVFYAQYKKFLFWHYITEEMPIELVPYGAEPPRFAKPFAKFEDAVNALHVLVPDPKSFKKYYDVYIPKN